MDIQKKTLNGYDRELIKKYLWFYWSLDSGARFPTTGQQAHFVAVVRGKARAMTQHEIAYTRYLLTLEQLATKSDPPFIVADNQLGLERSSSWRPDSVDDHRRAAERRQADTSAVGDECLFAKLDVFARGAWTGFESRLGNCREGVAQAAIWTSSLMAGRGLSTEVGRWLGGHFNDLSTIYTKAMDGEFARSCLQAGSEYVSPSLHRLFDGSHTVIGSLEACLAAMPDDSVLQALGGWADAYISDFSSVTGMPIITLSAEALNSIQSIMDRIGASKAWTVDIVHANLEELFVATVPALALLLNWNAADQQQFARLVGSLSVTAVWSANPIAIVVMLVALARSYSALKERTARPLDFVRGIASGSGLSTLLIATSTIVAGPVWIGVVSALIVGLLASRVSRLGVSELRAIYSVASGRLRAALSDSLRSWAAKAS